MLCALVVSNPSKPVDVFSVKNTSGVEASETNEASERVSDLEPNLAPPWDDEVAIDLRTLEFSVNALDEATKIP